MLVTGAQLYLAVRGLRIGDVWGSLPVTDCVNGVDRLWLLSPSFVTCSPICNLDSKELQ